MSLVIREEGSVPLPEDLAYEFGLHKGSHIQWERTQDGALKLRPAIPREEAVAQLGELLKPYLKEQGGGVEEFLRWREQDARLDGSL